jgi:hypothetical protein
MGGWRRVNEDMASAERLPRSCSVPSVMILALVTFGAAGCYASHDGGRDVGPARDAGRDAGPTPDAGTTRDAGPIRDSGAPDAPVDAFVRDTPTPIDTGVPCPPVLPDRPSAADRVGLLAWFQRAIVGRWRGERASPWDASPPAVSIEFSADGTYEARCEPAREDCAPLYWGDAVVRGPSARYRINDTTASGMGTGRLSPLWDGVPSWEAHIEDLVIDETGGHLEMRALDPEGRGPLVFSLDRTCE